MMSALLTSVLVASLLGSLHCAAMCGPFVAVCVVGDAKQRRLGEQLVARAPYHLGRLLTYFALGGVAGALGATVDGFGHAVGVSRLAAIISGVLVLVSGMSLLAPRLGLPSLGQRLLGTQAKKLVQLRTKSQATRAGILGALTPLLPCGWLYAFVMTAAGTGGALSGASLMAVFWLGTVPALLGMDVLLAKLSVHIRRYVPLLSGVTLILLGLFTIGRRLDIELPRRTEASHEVQPAATQVPSSSSCHCHQRNDGDSHL